MIFIGDYVVDRYLEVGHDFSGGVTQNTLLAFCHATSSSAIEAWALGRVGDDLFGRSIIRSLSKIGTQTQGLVTVQGQTPVFEILRDSMGERSFRLAESGCFPVEKSDAVTDLEHFLKTFPNRLHSELCFFPTYPNVEAYLQAALEVHAFQQAQWVVDLSDEPILERWDGAMIREVASRTRFIFRSIENTNSESEKELRAQFFAAQPSLEWVNLRGKEGVQIWSQGGFCEISAPQVSQVLDTNGAGDAFAGTYLAHRLQQGASPEKAAVYATEVAQKAIMQLGALFALKF